MCLITACTESLKNCNKKEWRHTCHRLLCNAWCFQVWCRDVRHHYRVNVSFQPLTTQHTKTHVNNRTMQLSYHSTESCNIIQQQWHKQVVKVIWHKAALPSTQIMQKFADKMFRLNSVNIKWLTQHQLPPHAEARDILRSVFCCINAVIQVIHCFKLLFLHKSKCASANKLCLHVVGGKREFFVGILNDTAVVADLTILQSLSTGRKTPKIALSPEGIQIPI